MSDIADLRSTIVPKSDQLNAEQLLATDLTITITDVRMGSEDQPVILNYSNDEGRPYKPCKTMRKLLIFAWGEDGRNWIGKSMTLYNDQAVRFGGMVVGGIRISHLSHIEREISLSLTATKGKKAQHTILPLEVVTLQDVLAAIAAATDRNGMNAAKAQALKLTVAQDAQKAQDAYNARMKELRGGASGAKPRQQPEPPPADETFFSALTVNQVLVEISKATDVDVLDLAMDGFRSEGGFNAEQMETIDAAYQNHREILLGA